MFFRTTLTATVIASLALLGACGGDEEPAETEPASVNPTKEARTDCEAEVELTDQVKKAWSGEAFVITENQSGPVLYRAAKGKIQLTLLSAEGDFDALGQLRVGKKSYTTQGGSVEVNPDGSGAEVDADAHGKDGNDVVHITASITC